MLEAVEGNVPRLSKLRIGISQVDKVYEGPGISPSPSPLVKAFNEAPALKEVSFDRLGVENTVLPWSRRISLTDIRENIGRSKILVEILSLSSHLKTLNFKSEIPEDYNHFQSWTDKIVHAELQSLTCSIYFMKEMKFPRLTSLTVRPKFEEGGYADDAINTLITSSQCSLRFLHIDDPYMTDSFFQALASTPELTQLELCFLQWDYEYTIGGFEELALRMDAFNGKRPSSYHTSAGISEGRGPEKYLRNLVWIHRLSVYGYGCVEMELRCSEVTASPGRD